MKILIDTTQEKLFVLLVQKDFSVVDYYLESEIKKSDLLNVVVTKILKDNKVSINEVDSIYVTTGPGSFMGDRAGLIFARTISQVSKIKLFTGTSFNLYVYGKEDTYYIDAKGNTSYKGKLNSNNKFEVSLVDGVESFSTPLYKEIIKSPKQLFDMFEEVKNLKEIKPTYIKEPRIGGR